jgi:hypothetical protein
MIHPEPLAFAGGDESFQRDQFRQREPLRNRFGEACNSLIDDDLRTCIGPRVQPFRQLKIAIVGLGMACR